jgi:hypothetical protein
MLLAVCNAWQLVARGQAAAHEPGQAALHCCGAASQLHVTQQTCDAVRACNACFLGNVIWDPRRTHDVYGPPSGRPVVLVHGALIGRACMALEARALAAKGYRCAYVHTCMHICAHSTCVARWAAVRHQVTDDPTCH